MARKRPKNKGMNGWGVFGISMLAVLIVAGVLFGTGALSIGDTAGEDGVQVTCGSDFEKQYTLNSENFYEPTEDVDTANTVVYQLWLIEGEEKVRQADLAEAGTFTLEKGQSMEVIATVNGTVDVIAERKVFSVSDTCEASNQETFKVKAVPGDITVRFDNDDIDGAVAEANRVPIVQGSDAVVEAKYTGAKDTTTKAIIVFDADEDIIDDMESASATVAVPASHSEGAGEDSYAFEIGQLAESTKIAAQYTMTADDAATVGQYNVSYTIYSLQSGYINSDTGDWDAIEGVDDNDEDTALLPTYEGVLELTISS